MAEEGSKKVVAAAVVGNSLIAAAKFTGGAISGSSAMLAEGIHSVVDTGNNLLLFVGMSRSKKPADSLHPFGYGKELYFWTLIVAIVLFAGGGGLSIYEGVTHLLHPHPIENPLISYIVLGCAVIFEGISWTIATREVLHAADEEGFFHALKTTKDPTVVTVFLEDSAALLSLAIAFTGLFLAHTMGDPLPDGIASIVIGGILSAVAVFLAWESRGLLVGESADPDMVDSIRELALSDPAVQETLSILTMHVGPRFVLVTLELKFRRGLSAGEAAKAMERLEREIRERHPIVGKIFIELASAAESQSPVQ